jgi:hypothetical protein
LTARAPASIDSITLLSFPPFQVGRSGDGTVLLTAPPRRGVVDRARS